MGEELAVHCPVAVGSQHMDDVVSLPGVLNNEEFKLTLEGSPMCQPITKPTDPQFHIGLSCSAIFIKVVQ